jgi:hypothetical protein
MRIRAKGPNHLPGRMPWQISEARAGPRADERPLWQEPVKSKLNRACSGCYRPQASGRSFCRGAEAGDRCGELAGLLSQRTGSSGSLFDHGGVALSRFTASAVLLAIMGVIMVVIPQRAAIKSH